MKPDFETTTQTHYQSQRELGRGEDTRVDLIFDDKRQLQLARKTWEHTNAELRFRLRQQHRRSLNITHPNIVKVYDLLADNDETALTMEFVQGSPAPEYLARLSSLGASAQQRLAATLFLLRQLANALETLHKADIVHRAVKPQNWLVEDTGRAVLLDAGLAWPPERSATAENAAHASPYVSPECLRGALHSVESDWYSFGVMAFELLTGARPFKGSLESVLRAKDRPIESLRDACPVIPDDLDDLVLALLSRDPRARPAYDEIAQVLDTLEPEYPFDPHGYADPPPTKPSHVQLKATAAAGVQPSSATENVAESPLMIARTKESPSEQLLSASVPRVAEHSGGAKLRHLSPALLDEPATLLVGEVADELAELVDDVVRTLPPTPPSNEMQAEVAATGGDDQTAEIEHIRPQTTGELAFAQITEQLTNERGQALLCVRGAPGAGKTSLMAALGKNLADQPGYLAVSTGAAAPALKTLHELTRQLAHTLGDELPNTLQLIEPAQRSALVRLCPALGGADPHIDVSAANPQLRLIDAHLGLRALFKQLCAHKPVMLLIDDAHKLDADTLAALRALLTSPVVPGFHVVITLDSTTLPAEAFSAMLDGMSDAPSAARIFELNPLETRHSRPPERTADTPAPQAEVADAESLLLAAQKASESLALQHAADLFERAVQASQSASPTLLQQAALAHAAAGRLRDAARLWLSLARCTSEPAQAQHFEIEAGACYLRAGDDEQGLSIMRGVLRSVGLHWPRTPLLTSTVERARSLLRQSRPPTAIKPAEQSNGHPQRFEALWGVAKELVLIAPDVSDALCARSLREAQAAGSRSQLLWALGYEATSAANIGGVFMQRRAATLNTQVRELADASANAYDLAFATSVEAVVSWFQGDWSEAEQRLRVALQAYSCVETATSQERHVLGNFLIAALEAQGKLFALRDAIAEVRLAALQSGHSQALAFCELSAAGVGELAQDRPLQAIDRADAVLSTYGASSGFTPLHFQHFVATTNARLYAGHHAQAYQQVEQAWQQLRRSHLAQLEGVAMMVHQLRARAALALASQSVDHEAERLRAQAHKLSNTLGRSGLPHVLALRHVIEANAAALARHRSSAEAHCLRASELFDVAGMPLYREAARMARSAAGEGIEARIDATQSSSLLAQAGVQDPARFTAAWFPVLREQLLELAGAT
jgi:serine/threonine protein kinase/tetratricopeptide (TPR) repeat protein